MPGDGTAVGSWNHLALLGGHVGTLLPGNLLGLGAALLLWHHSALPLGHRGAALARHGDTTCLGGGLANLLGGRGANLARHRLARLCSSEVLEELEGPRWKLVGWVGMHEGVVE